MQPNSMKRLARNTARLVCARRFLLSDSGQCGRHVAPESTLILEVCPHRRRRGWVQHDVITRWTYARERLWHNDCVHVSTLKWHGAESLLRAYQPIYHKRRAGVDLALEYTVDSTPTGSNVLGESDDCAIDGNNV